MPAEWYPWGLCCLDIQAPGLVRHGHRIGKIGFDHSPLAGIVLDYVLVGLHRLFRFAPGQRQMGQLDPGWPIAGIQFEDLLV